MEPDKASYRTVKVIGALLILEVIGLVFIGAFEFWQVRWGGLAFEDQPHDTVEAAIAQGLSLAVSLWLYSWFQPNYVYPIMAYCVIMILYLNSREVRVAFLPRQDREASYDA